MLKLGLGPISLLLVSSALTLPAIAKPAPATRAKTTTRFASNSEASKQITKLTAYQIGYFQQHGHFSETFAEVVSSQPVFNKKHPVDPETAHYSYKFFAHPKSGNMTMIAAVPKQSSQSSRLTIIGLLVSTRPPKGADGKAKIQVNGILCPSKAPGAAVPTWDNIGELGTEKGFKCPAGF